MKKNNNMVWFYPALIILGLLLLGTGFWGAYNWPRPWSHLGAICIPLGLIIALLGVLLTTVPNFFSSP